MQENRLRVALRFGERLFHHISRGLSGNGGENQRQIQQGNECKDFSAHKGNTPPFSVFVKRLVSG
jgi:hypothetical protein